MAELVSPGVSISVNDESFYAAAGAGTVPLIIIATAQDKTSPDGTGTAAFTKAAEAGKLKLITSQRELLQNYGNPLFYSSGSTQLNGYDLNEYGLLAAHSFLGLANRAYIVRADIDLGEIEASSTAPTGAITDGAYWLDTASSSYGLREYVSGKWVKKAVKVCDAANINSGTGAPKQAFGLDGDYAVVAVTASGGTTSSVKYYEKYSSDWYEIGSTSWTAATSSDFQFASHLAVPTLQSGNSSLADGDIFIQTTTPNTGADFVVKAYSSAKKAFSTVASPVYTSTDAAYTAIGTANVVVGNVIGVTGTTADVEFRRHTGNVTLEAVGNAVSGTVDVTGNSSIAIVYNGTTVTVTLAGSISGTPATSTVEDAVFDINSALSAAGVSEVVASEGDNTNIVLTSSTGRDIAVNSNHSDFGPSTVGFGTGAVTQNVVYSNFADLSYEASKVQITGTLAVGTYWYDATVSKLRTDLLENDAANGWVTFGGDLSVISTKPTTQSDGSAALKTGDIWLDSDDTENFPALYRYDATASAWVAVVKSDQVTADGVVFADFRQSSTSSLDTDAPASTAYPVGILGFNKRASGGNVKEYDGAKWVDASGNKVDGDMFGLRKAVHNLVKTKMQAAISDNDDIRSEINAFNLIVAPGFPEMIDEMITLSGDRRNTCFVIGDTPMRLKADATSTQAWATNANNASENGEDGWAGQWSMHGQMDRTAWRYG